jgi:ActR/RegA family two-component response regulator
MTGVGAAVERGGSARLLVVEDDPAISRPLVRALEREGFVVDQVDNGEAAVLGGRPTRWTSSSST